MYKVQVSTGDHKGAVADTNVTLIVYGGLNGENEDSGKQKLDNGQNNLKIIKQLCLDEVPDDSGSGSGKHSFLFDNIFFLLLF